MKNAVKHPTGGDSTIWEHLGDVHIKLKHKKEATAAYEKALEDIKKAKPIDQKRVKEIEEKTKVNDVLVSDMDTFFDVGYYEQADYYH